MFAISIFFFSKLNYAWWWYPLLFFAPDLSMLGYSGGTRTGAFVYNFVHHKALSIGIFVIGAMLASQPLQLAGLIFSAIRAWIAFLGYGLKYEDLFQHTHLGMIGNSK